MGDTEKCLSFCSLNQRRLTAFDEPNGIIIFPVYLLLTLWGKIFFPVLLLLLLIIFNIIILFNFTTRLEVSRFKQRPVILVEMQFGKLA